MNFKKITSIFLMFNLVFNLVLFNFCSAEESSIDLGKISVLNGEIECFPNTINSVDFEEKSVCKLRTMILSNKNIFSAFMKDSSGHILTEQSGENGAVVLEHIVKRTGDESSSLGYKICVKNDNGEIVKAVGALVSDCKVKKPMSLLRKMFYAWLIYAVPALLFGGIPEILNGMQI